MKKEICKTNLCEMFVALPSRCRMNLAIGVLWVDAEPLKTVSRVM